MTGKTFTVTRQLASKRFTPKKTPAQRAFEFIEKQATLANVPYLDADYAIKAARPRAQRARNAAADNKAPREKAAGPNKRFGVLVFDPEEKWAPGKVFIPYVRRTGRNGASDDIPNWGWISEPTILKHEDIPAVIQQHMLGLYKKPRVTFRDGFRNPKTGQLGTKALGPTLSEIRRGAGGLANIARGVTRGLGLVEDALGRLRCPPGVPAAMQFTDDMGSNCFGISAGDVVKATRQALRARREIMEGIDDVQKAYERIRSLRSGSRVTGGEGFVVPRVPSTEAEMEAIADAVGVAREIKPNIVESPGKPILVRSDGTISPTAIVPEQYEDDIRAALRFVFPDATNADIEKKVAQAKAQYAMAQAVNGRIQTVMMKLKEMGIEIDATDPTSVTTGLVRGFEIMRERGDINFDPDDFYRYLGIDALPEGATTEEKVRFAHAQVAELIATKFFNMDGRGRAVADGAARYEDYIPEDGVKSLLEYYDEATDVFGGESVELKVRKDFVKYALGELDLTDFDERLHPALKAFKAQFTAYQTQEQGLMIGLQFMHHENPGVLESLSRVEAVNPFSPGWETGDAEVMPDTMSGDDMKVIMRWNPLGTVFTTRQAAIKRGEYRLYESDGRGLAVEQLVEIGKAATDAARKQLLDNFMKPFGDTYEDVFNPDTPSFLKEIYDEHVGIIGKSMWIIEHEMTHARQIELAYRILGTNASGERIHTLTNKELAMLVHQSLMGANPLFDSSYIFQNPKFSSKLAALAVNMDAMNENGTVGQYARGHYLAALELKTMFEMTPEQRHAHLESLYKEIAELQNAQETKTITLEQEIRLNSLGLVAQQLSAVSADKVDEFFSNEAFYDHVRMQVSINFLESTAELHAGRRMGLIPDTPEVRTALEYLDLDAAELRAKIDIHKEEQNKLDEFIGKVVTEFIPNVDVEELARQSKFSRDMIQEAQRRIDDINRGRARPGADLREKRLSRIERMIESGALTKSEAEQYIDRANERLFGNVGRGEYRYSRGYLGQVREWIDKNIGKSDLRDFTDAEKEKLVQYLDKEGPEGDLKILSQYPGWDNKKSWEIIQSRLSGSCAQGADPKFNECRRVKDAVNRMNQYSRLITVITDVEQVKKYKDKAPTVRPPGKNIDPQTGESWVLPKIQSQSRPREMTMRSAGRSAMTPGRTVGIPSRANEETVQKLRATTKRFDTTSSLHRYGILSRERSSEIATISERRAIEQELPEKNDARLPSNEIGLRAELSMSASRRQSGGKTLDKKIKEDIIPIMTLIDKSPILDDVAVTYALPESVHGALTPGSKLKLNNITRARIIDEEAKGIRSSSRGTRRMILRVPGGSKGVFDHDYAGRPEKLRGQMTAVLMPPGEVEIIDRLQDGTVIGELKNQQTSQSVLGDIISRLSQIIDRQPKGSQNLWRYEARSAMRVAEQYRDTVMNIQQGLPQWVSGYRSSSRSGSSIGSIKLPDKSAVLESNPIKYEHTSTFARDLTPGYSMEMPVYEINGNKIVFGFDETGGEWGRPVEKLGFSDKGVEVIPFDPYAISGKDEKSPEGREVALKFAHALIGENAETESGQQLDSGKIAALLYAGSRGDKEAMAEFERLASAGRINIEQRRAERARANNERLSKQRAVGKKLISEMRPDGTVETRQFEAKDIFAVHQTSYEPEVDKDGNLTIKPVQDAGNIKKSLPGSTEAIDGQIERSSIHMALNHLVAGHEFRAMPQGDTYAVISPLLSILDSNPGALDNLLAVDTYLTPAPGEPLKIPAGKFKLVKLPGSGLPETDDFDELSSAARQEKLRKVAAEHKKIVEEALRLLGRETYGDGYRVDIFDGGKDATDQVTDNRITEIATELGTQSGVHSQSAHQISEIASKSGPETYRNPEAIIGHQRIEEMSDNALARLFRGPRFTSARVKYAPRQSDDDFI